MGVMKNRVFQYCALKKRPEIQAAVFVLKAVSGEPVCNHQKLIEFGSQLLVDSEDAHGFHDVSPLLLTNVKSNLSKLALLLGALIGKNRTCDRKRNGGEQFVGEAGEGTADTRGVNEIVVIVVGGNQVTHNTLLLSFVHIR